MRRELVVVELDEELGTRADDLEGRHPDEEQVRRGVDPAEAPVQADAVELLAGGGIDGQVERLAAGQDDLDRLAGGDRVLGDLDGVDVLVAAEARVDRRGGRGVVGRRPRPDPLPLPRARAVVPAISAADGRDVFSRASKIAASAMR